MQSTGQDSLQINTLSNGSYITAVENYQFAITLTPSDTESELLLQDIGLASFSISANLPRPAAAVRQDFKRFEQCSRAKEQFDYLPELLLMHV